MFQTKFHQARGLYLKLCIPIFHALEQQIRGNMDYRKLLIIIPPGMMKSLAVSVIAPAYEWLHASSRRKLMLSNDIDLASRDSQRTRELMQTDWYHALITYAYRAAEQPLWSIAKDQNEKVQ